ncbi:zinc finger, C3HC4 type (RING finger) domain containing protein [Acanthamoeba castellanii str. Neff]|uniref:E3 ubiquitin protein ligase n=1 Tax=Acanthamoeba castellanii (strain ATCC 30010 / Neff) TaxID=1257118 RepID=L8GVM7_ACACF|nr:zinc finger, C3HC4 type (RING finger) domain containing protein [Acanthamoeba castellanii str. Neff]ELR16638.1 zinc finger, C3HC4 type (RING finger) domain containing protein [Acanthamoeba castellanii str. Neff]
MSNNKRKLSASTPAATSHPPPKKRSFQASGSGGGGATMAAVGYGVTFGAAGEKSELELLQYQNQSLSTLLKEKKEEISSLRTKLRTVEAKERESSNGLAYVTQHWSSLDENLHTVLATIEPATVDEILREESRRVHPPEDERSFLQMLLGDEGDLMNEEERKDIKKEKELGNEDEQELDEEEAEARDEEYQKLLLKQRIDPALERRSSFTKQILIRVCDALQKQKRRSDDLARRLQDAASLERVMVEESNGLREQVAGLDKLVAKLQHKNMELSRGYSSAKTGWVQAEQKIRVLTMDIEDFKADLSTCHNRIERLNKALQEAQTKAATAAANAPAPAAAASTSSSSSSSPSLGSHEAPEEVQKIREELADARTVEENRLKEIQKLRQDRAELKNELNELNDKLLNLPEHVVRTSPAFRMLETHLQMAVMDYESQRGLCSQLQRSVATLEQERREEKDRAQKNEQARRQELEKEIKEKDAALARIRGERDNLIYRLEQKKASLPSQQLINEFKMTIATLQDQSAKLRKELEKLREQKDKERGREPERAHTSEPRAPEVAELQEKVKVLQRGMDDFKRKHDDAQRELRSITESLPREQRELHEIRRNERKLADENTYLKSRLAKYEPKNKLEKDYPRLLSKADQSIRELQKSLDATKAENAAYLSEMEVISKEFESTMEQNTRLLHELSDKDETTTKLMSDRIKSEQLQNQLREETKQLQFQIKLAGERYEQQKELLKREETKAKMIEEQMIKANEQISSFTNLIEAHKRAARDAAQQLVEFKAKLDQATAALAEYKKKLDEQSSALERGEDKISRLMEERNTLKRKVERLSARGSVDTLLEEEVSTLRKMLRCPVCNDNMKDTVITRCFHVFCNPCVKSRLQLRNRKCPGCAKPFGENDVHSIYLGFDDVKDEED